MPERSNPEIASASLSAANTVNDPGITIGLSSLSIFHAWFQLGGEASFGRSQNPGFSVWKQNDTENIMEQSIMTTDM